MVRLLGYPALLLAAMLVGALAWDIDIRQEAHRAWDDFRESQAIKSIVRHGNQMPQVDEVRIFRLASSATANAMGTYHSPYFGRQDSGKTLFIVRTATVNGQEAERIASLWRSLTFYPGTTAGCFVPHHLIRFFWRSEVVSEVEVCFTCKNAALPGIFWQRLVSVTEPAPQKPDSFQQEVERLVGRHEKDDANPTR